MASADRALHVLHGHSGTVKCVAWDPAQDGNVLCSGGRDGSICLWDLRVCESRNGTGTLKPVLVIPKAHESDVKTPKPKGRRMLRAAAPIKGVTHLLYSDAHPHGIISSNSFDGRVALPSLHPPRLTFLQDTEAMGRPPPQHLQKDEPPSQTKSRLHVAHRPDDMRRDAPRARHHHARRRVWAHRRAALRARHGLARTHVRAARAGAARRARAHAHADTVILRPPCREPVRALARVRERRRRRRVGPRVPL